MPLKTETQDLVVCAGVVVDIDTDETFYQLQYPTHIGRKSRVIAAQTYVSPQLLVKELCRYGYNGDPKAIIDLSQGGTQRTLDVTKITERGGWVDGRLVTRFGVFGPDEFETELGFKPDHQHFKPFKRGGTIDDFMSGYRELMIASPEVCFSYLAALAAPLGSHLGRSSFSVCFSSESTTGKTSVIAFAQSLYTYAYNDDELVNFGDTIGVFLDELDAFGGTVTGFADVKNAREKRGDWTDKIQTLTFSAASGHRRRRLSNAPISRNSGHGRKIFNIFMLATERPLSELYQEGGTQREGGDMTRLIEIPVASRADGGIFCSVSDATERARLSAKFDELRRTQHGTVIPDWAKHLSENELAKPKRLSKKIRASEQVFVENLNEQDPLFKRIGKHLALLAAVVPIANRAGLLPAEPDVFIEALHEIYRRVVKTRKSLELEQLRYNHERMQEILNNEFYPVVKQGSAAASPQRASVCFKRKEEKTTLIHLHADSFIAAAEDTSRHLAVKFIKWLKDNVRLKSGSGKTDTRIVKQEGIGRRRYLVFTRNRATEAAQALQEALRR